jgi:hypothetical protein
MASLTFEDHVPVRSERTVLAADFDQCIWGVDARAACRTSTSPSGLGCTAASGRISHGSSCGWPCESGIAGSPPTGSLRTMP